MLRTPDSDAFGCIEGLAGMAEGTAEAHEHLPLVRSNMAAERSEDMASRILSAWDDVLESSSGEELGRLMDVVDRVTSLIEREAEAVGA